jgi:phosphoglycerol transferase MdoB-like AlkP superfamily enzyme
MSAEVIDEFNNLNLNLTPNLNKLYRSSFVFKNYYNHTAATFRGLRGQLFSSYQYLGGYYSDGTGFGEIDKAELIKRTDTRLISIIDILKGAGYETSFINTEPSNVQFSNYLETFHFDKILSGDVMDRYLTDKEAFHLLKDTVFDLEEPFFIGMYNIGTHHGYDSPDKKYGNGDNPVLNKFFNYDTWFGDFFNCLLETDIFDNTMLIFTTDHASFNSPEYIHTFNSNQKYFVNTIPLFIYWNGMDHTIADANGRNSLDLAPTILDLLGIYNHRNYFLGSSLFTESIGDFNRISAIGDEFYYSGTKGIVPIRKDHKNEIELIYQYYGISMNYD